MITYFLLAGFGGAALAWALTPLWGQRRRTCLTLTASISVAATALYLALGRPDAPALLEAHEAKMQEVAWRMAQASTKVKADSSDLAAWVELGDAFLEAEQYASAENAYRQAVILSQGNPALILQYAKAQILTANGLTDEARKSLEMVLTLEPDNAEARRLFTASPPASR